MNFFFPLAWVADVGSLCVHSVLCVHEMIEKTSEVPILPFSLLSAYNESSCLWNTDWRWPGKNGTPRWLPTTVCFLSGWWNTRSWHFHSKELYSAQIFKNSRVWQWHRLRSGMNLMALRQCFQEAVTEWKEEARRDPGARFYSFITTYVKKN